MLKHSPNAVTKNETMELINYHKTNGFAFTPHNIEKIEGDITYGDTSMTLDYIRNNFKGLEIERVEVNEVDLYQVIVFLKKSNITTNLSHLVILSLQIRLERAPTQLQHKTNGGNMAACRHNTGLMVV